MQVAPFWPALPSIFQVQAEEGQICKEQDPGQGPQLQEEDPEEGWKTLNYLTLFTNDCCSIQM